MLVLQGNKKLLGEILELESNGRIRYNYLKLAII